MDLGRRQLWLGAAAAAEKGQNQSRSAGMAGVASRPISRVVLLAVAGAVCLLAGCCWFSVPCVTGCIQLSEVPTEEWIFAS